MWLNIHDPDTKDSFGSKMLSYQYSDLIIIIGNPYTKKDGFYYEMMPYIWQTSPHIFYIFKQIALLFFLKT